MASKWLRGDGGTANRAPGRKPTVGGRLWDRTLSPPALPASTLQKGLQLRKLYVWGVM